MSRKKEHSLIADTKLQVDQLKRKIEAKFKKRFFKKKNKCVESQNDHKLSSNQLDKIIVS